MDPTKRRVKERGGCGGTTKLPIGKQWVPHQGLRQRLRVLRRNWAQFEKLCKKNEYVAATRERMLDVAVEVGDRENQPAELVAMSLALTARVLTSENFSPDTAVSGNEDDQFIVAVNKVLNEAESQLDAPTP
jgi:hypothetical protein